MNKNDRRDLLSLVHNIVIDGRVHNLITKASMARLDSYCARHNDDDPRGENICVDVSHLGGFGQGLINYYAGHEFLWFDVYDKKEV